MTDVFLRSATPDDIDWIVSQEQRDDFAAFISRWPRAQHLENLTDSDKRYLVADDSRGQRVGFVILAGAESAARSIELLRMVVADPGAGVGRRLLPAVIRLSFDELGANRLWLDVFDDNERAQRAYRRAGFIEEGRLREAALRGDGRHGTLVIMSILASDDAAH